MALSNKREVRQVIKTTLQPFVDDGSIELEDLKEMVKSVTDYVQLPVNEENTKLEALKSLLEFCQKNNNNSTNCNSDNNSVGANSLVTRVTETIKTLRSLIDSQESKVEKPALVLNSDINDTAEPTEKVPSTLANFADNTSSTSTQQANSATSSFSISALRARLAQRKRELESEDSLKKNEEIVNNSTLPALVSEGNNSVDNYTTVYKNYWTLPKKENEEETIEPSCKNGSSENCNDGSSIDVTHYSSQERSDKVASKVICTESSVITNNNNNGINSDNSKTKLENLSSCLSYEDNRLSEFYVNQSVPYHNVSDNVNVNKRNREASSESTSQTVKTSRNEHALKTPSLFAAHDNGIDDSEDIDAALYDNITFAKQLPHFLQMHATTNSNNNNNNNSDVINPYQQTFQQYQNNHNYYYYDNNNINNKFYKMHQYNQYSQNVMHSPYSQPASTQGYQQSAEMQPLPIYTPELVESSNVKHSYTNDSISFEETYDNTKANSYAAHNNQAQILTNLEHSRLPSTTAKHMTPSSLERR